MSFTVTYQADTTKDEHGDDATFEFLNGGVLKVVSADTNGKTFYLAPTVWKSVMADKHHTPMSEMY